MNGYNSTHGGGLRIFQGLVRFLGTLPKGEFAAPPMVLFSPRHDLSLIDEARISGLHTLIYRPTGIQALDQVILYFVHLPIRAFFAKQSECLLNLGDFIVPLVRRQVYYFDWLYAVIEANDIWKQMPLPLRIARGFKRANIRTLIKTPHIVIVQSQFVANQMTQMLGGVAPKIIPCPVDVVVVPTPPSDPLAKKDALQSLRLICLSSFATHKNVEILLNVAQILKSRNLKVQIVLTLDRANEDVRAFQKRIDKNELSDVIVNVGVVDFAEVDTWISNCDALLLPTKLESFGLPYVESLARGRPILTSDLPFAHEICKTGTMFFDPDNPISIADTIEEFIQSGGVPIDQARVNEIVESCRPERVFSEVLSQVRF